MGSCMGIHPTTGFAGLSQNVNSDVKIDVICMLHTNSTHRSACWYYVIPLARCKAWVCMASCINCSIISVELESLFSLTQLTQDFTSFPLQLYTSNINLPNYELRTTGLKDKIMSLILIVVSNTIIVSRKQSLMFYHGVKFMNERTIIIIVIASEFP